VPLPKSVAHFNKRVTNRLTRHVAGWMPGFAIVASVGRRSAKSYQTPVNVFLRNGRYVLALEPSRRNDHTLRHRSPLHEEDEWMR
jgi:hypothetical protein